MFEGNPLLSLLWVLVCVVVIVGMAYWFTKFAAGPRGLGAVGMSRGAPQMQILARVTVGKEQNLLLARVGQRYFLLGSAPGGLSTLAEFSREEAEAWVTETERPEGGQSVSFGEALREAIKEKWQR